MREKSTEFWFRTSARLYNCPARLFAGLKLVTRLTVFPMTDVFESLIPDDHSGSVAAVPEFSPDHRTQLELAQSYLNQAGFYAYLMVDDQQRWTLAADDEDGRVDVRVEDESFLLEVCGSSPGLFMEEDSEWRRTALERLARRVIPNVARGLLQEHESATWSEVDRGVEACIAHAIPLSSTDRIAVLARQSLEHLDGLLSRVESELRT